MSSVGASVTYHCGSLSLRTWQELKYSQQDRQQKSEKISNSRETEAEQESWTCRDDGNEKFPECQDSMAGRSRGRRAENKPGIVA